MNKLISAQSYLFIFILLGVLSGGCTPEKTLEIRKGSKITLVGNNLGSRMMEYGLFETEMHMRYPDSTLFIRNLCDP
ncbi:MAG: hypothetical protein MUE75_07890, partial [Algoriphagus sp.]|nr:hypothetical protein [Algoriphagus sp.]